MKRLLLLLLLIFAAVALSPILIDEKGYILIAMGDLTVESTVVTATIMLVLTFMALLIALKVFRGSLHFSFAAWNKIAFASRRRAMRDLNKGIAAYVLGDYKQIRTLISKICRSIFIRAYCLFSRRRRRTKTSIKAKYRTLLGVTREKHRHLKKKPV